MVDNRDELKQYSKEELIQILTNLREKHGKKPTREMLRADPNLPKPEEFVRAFFDLKAYEALADQYYLGVAPYSRQDFGWNRALIAADLEPETVDTTLTRILDTINYIKQLNRPFDESDIKQRMPIAFRCTSVRKTLGLIDCYKGQFKTDLILILGMENYYGIERELKISDVTDSSFETFIEDHPDRNFTFYYTQNKNQSPRKNYLDLVTERYISFNRAVKLAHQYKEEILSSV